MALDLPDYRPYIRAVVCGRNSEVETYLLQHPNFLDAPDDRGLTPLHRAAIVGAASTIELLLRKGSISLNSPTNAGMTPLIYAAAFAESSTVELFLKQEHISIDLADSNGGTALYYAVNYKEPASARILKAVGATIPSGVDLNPRDLAVLHESIPEEAILEIRYRIYFDASLLSRLL